MSSRSTAWAYEFPPLKAEPVNTDHPPLPAAPPTGAGAETFELLAASLRADARDVGAFVEALAEKFCGAFPDSARVERTGFAAEDACERSRFHSGTIGTAWKTTRGG